MKSLEADAIVYKLIYTTFPLMLFASLACRPIPPESESELGGLIANQADINKKVKNYALVVVGDSDGIPGTMTDFQRMPGIMRGLGFEVITLQYPSSAQLLSTITQISRDMATQDAPAMGAHQRGGTFAFYVTSHGGPDGSTSMGGGSDFVTMPQIAQAAANGRGGIPFQRFITMFDTCYSATNRPGLQAANGGFGLAKAEEFSLSNVANNYMNEMRNFKGLYLSSYAWFSSRSFETSADTGAGGEATVAFVNAINGGGNAGVGSLFSGLGQGGGLGLANDETAGTQMSAQAAAEVLGASHRNVSTLTLGDIADRMSASMVSQKPVICAHPPMVFREPLADTPLGVLPPLIANLDGVRNTQQRCVGE